MANEKGKKQNQKKTRKKPKFYRQDWHKMIKLGSSVKKNRKWRAAKGKHSKIRQGIKGKARKVKVGWGNDKSFQQNIMRVENFAQLQLAFEQKVDGVILAKIGAKKKADLVKKAHELKLKILNKYKPETKTE